MLYKIYKFFVNRKFQASMLSTVKLYLCFDIEQIFNLEKMFGVNQIIIRIYFYRVLYLSYSIANEVCYIGLLINIYLCKYK